MRPEPEEHGDGTDEKVIADALQLLADFDNTPLTQMTPLFYQHGFEELRTTTGDLLRILGHDPDAKQAP
ncbi:MAG: hypothetical protein HOQ06_01590 [Pseudarthrobacter sp.]|nr:hypothetical protein [Pseudarthrobacter sp.]